MNSTRKTLSSFRAKMMKDHPVFPRCKEKEVDTQFVFGYLGAKKYGPLGDFVLGPYFPCVSQRVKDELEQMDSEASGFTRIVLFSPRSAPCPYYVWHIKPIRNIVESRNNPQAGDAEKFIQRVTFTTENLLDMDFAADDYFRGRWFCTDKPGGFYETYHRHKWTGLRFFEAWDRAELDASS